ncbi:leucine-rich repeat domain-containing protein [Thermobacillus sp.]|uniref:leucine-rich repeat domain-containing protein n=1 Tax=Thermobacillus sp. TaxID=2108467 RepID=UPI0025808E15|nr:leucine-rich repeat domain-containing protein [Thermobacillus sp.]
MRHRHRLRALLVILGALLIGAAGWTGTAAASLTGPLIPLPDIRIPLPGSDPVVEFPDPILKQWAIKELGVEGDVIRQSDIARYCEAFSRKWERILTIYSSAPGKIRSLEGIQAFKPCNVDYLVASRWEIRDVTPITELTTLRGLDLQGNLLEDIRPLGSLTELRTLILSGNRIASLDGLEGLTHLERAELQNNRIVNIDVVRNWTSLSELNLSGNPVRSLESLTANTLLSHLHLNQVNLREEAELRHLGRLTNLIQLSIRNNAIHDLTPISGLSRMVALDAGGNFIADLSPIASMTQMRTLKVDDNRIRDLEALKNFYDLFILDAQDNWISSLKPIENLVPHEVYLARNRIDTESADNTTVINRWLVRGSTVDVSDQNPGKPYPYEDEAAAPGGDPDPAAEDGAGDPGAGSGAGGAGSAGPDAGGPAAPPDDAEEWEDLPIIRGRHNFTDIAGHWAEADIQWAYERGIVNGIGNGKFDPTGITTEEQFLKMLLITMRGLTEEPVSTPWSRKYYEFALAYGYPVWPDQRGKPITRRAVAELIAATQGERLTGNDAIQYLLDKGLSSGKTSATIEGYFGDDYLTRAEAVRFIRNVISKAEHKTPQRLNAV